MVDVFLNVFTTAFLAVHNLTLASLRELELGPSENKNVQGEHTPHAHAAAWQLARIRARDV